MNKDNEEGIKLDVINKTESAEHNEENIQSPEKQNIQSTKSDGIGIKLNFIKKPQFWQGLSVILFISLIVSFFIILNSSNNEISKNDAKNRVQDYIDRLESVRPDANIEIIDIKKINGIYNAKLSIQEREIDSYLSKDGKLFFPTGIELDEVFNIPFNLIKDENLNTPLENETIKIAP